MLYISKNCPFVWVLDMAGAGVSRYGGHDSTRPHFEMKTFCMGVTSKKRLLFFMCVMADAHVSRYDVMILGDPIVCSMLILHGLEPPVSVSKK